MGIVNRILAWSFSRLEKYRWCPRLAKRTIIDKMKSPENEAMRRGSAIHKLAEDYALGLIKTLPEELARFAKDFAVAKKCNKMRVEMQIAFTKAWEVCDWFAKNTWVRVVIDLLMIDDKKKLARVVDHKTGKFRAESKEQLSLYALAIFLMFPEIETVSAELWYLDSGEKIVLLFQRSQMDELKKYWEGEVSSMMADTSFQPKPSKKCSWCDDSKAKGGTCQY